MLVRKVSMRIRSCAMPWYCEPMPEYTNHNGRASLLPHFCKYQEIFNHFTRT